MNTIEKGAAILGAAVIIFGAGIGWNSLSDRIDKVDQKITAIQKTLGSTPCTAILNRQLAAIDKGRADIRKDLDALSDQYGCVQQRNYDVAGAATNEASTVENATAATNLSAQLKAVDMQLNNGGRR